MWSAADDGAVGFDKSTKLDPRKIEYQKSIKLLNHTKYNQNSRVWT